MLVDISGWVQAVAPYGNPTSLLTQPRGQLVNPGSRGKWPLKRCVRVRVNRMWMRIREFLSLFSDAK